MVRAALSFGFTADLVVLTGVAMTVGLAPAGWLTGLIVGLAVNLLLVRGLARAGRRVGPADQVTLLRAALVGGVAALTVDSFLAPVSIPVRAAAAPVPVPVSVLVVLASIALALDAVDGPVARGTGTMSAVGARFDMETDALLILVLSCYDARLFGWWVLTIGLLRYAFVAAGVAWAWLRAPSPPRHWCKVVAAVQGIVLTAVAPALLPSAVAVGLILISLALLTESFGREVLWLGRHRGVTQPPILVGAGVNA
ncbi:CDP-alcohol phosphatidyltransferase-like enzyme [Jatrophihabitans sp. GAS493]|uniref:CDP-alcohol phosphatidyltransferase family protein n=1 Tax=Jatrophihabitans sp. GAS493 TaxID=1907575 RepID=UPI000BC0AC23|nr:CDP-alcohol phosphatidyltransferase family protein [Jatrophihabitans sp. GAS493]SOD74918.1 CDP-alcohol phosphatidyltransferase-like enzyme [Jatrophihabitans sp. GAS493]